MFQGYVLVEDYFSPEELDPVKLSVKRVLDDFAAYMHKHGKIKSE